MLRHLSWPEDRPSLITLDTSFTSDRVYQLEQTGRSIRLEEVSVSQPVHKSYPLAGEVEALPSFDWTQVASDGGQVVGLVAMKVEEWNRRAMLHHLYLAPSARRMGLGRRMVEAALGEARQRSARSLWVETQTINWEAIRFYQRMGFEWCGFDRSLYDPAEVQEREIALFFSKAVA